MTTAQTAAQAAHDAAEAIRALNLATLPHEGYPGLEYPGDVCDVIGSLKAVMQRMPQALAQCSRWLREQHEAGKAGHDSGRGAEAAEAVRLARYWLNAAEGLAEELENVLNQAHNESAHLTGR